MADNKTKLIQESSNKTIKKRYEENESFASLTKGITPIKRKSQIYNRFENQANFINTPNSTNRLEKNQNHNSAIKQIGLANKKESVKNSFTEKINDHNYPKLLPNERLEYRDFSISHKQMRALKAGKIRPKKIFDLHGFTRLQASELVSELIENYSNCTILIIHGKGYNSTKGESTLKSWLSHFLKQKSKVRAFASAPINDGGTGACYVLLK